MAASVLPLNWINTSPVTWGQSCLSLKLTDLVLVLGFDCEFCTVSLNEILEKMIGVYPTRKSFVQTSLFYIYSSWGWVNNGFAVPSPWKKKQSAFLSSFSQGVASVLHGRISVRHWPFLLYVPPNSQQPEISAWDLKIRNFISAFPWKSCVFLALRNVYKLKPTLSVCRVAVVMGYVAQYTK